MGVEEQQARGGAGEDVLVEVERLLRGGGDDARERALEALVLARAPDSVAAKAVRLHKAIADYAYYHGLKGDRKKLSEIETLAFELRIKAVGA